MIKVIKNVEIISMTHETAFYGGVAVDGDRIIMVAHDNSEIDQFIKAQGGDVEIVDGKGGVLMPGLINLHNHVSMTLLRGYADDLPLMPWLTDHIWPIENKMTPEHIYEGARLGIAEMLLGGTTTFVDMYASEDKVAEAGEKLGMRTIMGLAFLDQSYSRFEEFALKMVEKYSDSSSLVSFMMSPHAPYTCSPETLTKAVAFAKKYDMPIHTHLSETEFEVNNIKEQYGKSPVEYYRDLGLFDLKTLAAHCVHLSDSDMDILRDNGVSVSHNPQSNLKLACGIAEVAKLIERGINVGLGTDGPSSNNDLDMWEEMRTASFLQKNLTKDTTVLPAYEILKMATINGAKAIGREDDLGTIEVGKLADFIIVDTSRPHFYPRHNIISNMVYCGKASDVDSVMVNGEFVVRDKTLVKDDLESIYDGVQRSLEELGINE